MQITTIGLDIAKNVFQVHGIGAAEKVIVRKQLRRGQVDALLLNSSALMNSVRSRMTALFSYSEIALAALATTSAGVA
jgi:transposase